MLGLTYSHKIEGDTIYFRVSGFAVHSKVRHIKDDIISQIAKLEGKPFKVMFDLRGMKAVDPLTTAALKEIDDYLYTCSAIKVGTVLDSIIAKIQHIRLARDSKAKEMLDKGRSMIFSDPEQCRQWLASSN